VSEGRREGWRAVKGVRLWVIGEDVTVQQRKGRGINRTGCKG
jgi:hypothetical protein